jgi:hypothetical protein
MDGCVIPCTAPLFREKKSAECAEHDWNRGGVAKDGENINVGAMFNSDRHGVGGWS